MTASFVTIDSCFGPIRINPDPYFARHCPTRKVRGRRRYYQVLHRNAAAFAVNPSGWYDYMHWHADLSGLGNVSWSDRREHLRAHFTMFRRLLAETGTWEKPHQAWLQIDAFDASQDAVYLHTVNPNRANYPNPFEDTLWDAPIPWCLEEFVTEASWQFGRLDAQWTHFFVRLRTVA